MRVLAQILRSAPHELVDTLLHIALSLCNAGTAGISVLETLPDGQEVFRWTNLAGTLRKFIGGTTLRHFSPCGVCLDSGTPQLFSYPERRFQYLKEGLDVPIVEALVIPIPFGDRPPATIWILSHKHGVEFDAEHVRIMTNLADFTGCALHLIQRMTSESNCARQDRAEIAVRKQTEEQLKKSQFDLEGEVKLRTSQLRQLSAKLLTLQDEERRRIARDLHDSAGQYLCGIRMNLDIALKETPSMSPLLSARIVDSIELTDRCLSEVRTISHLLHPPLLDEVGLRSALSWYIEGFAKRSGIEVELNAPKELARLPSEIETALFRTVQQGLANIHRHSGSKVATILVEADGKSVCLDISDEGCGIPAELLKGFNDGTHLPGVGIAGIRERIRDMGGQFNIGSGVHGTTLRVSLPIPDGYGGQLQ